jgi:hypothetical protein
VPNWIIPIRDSRRQRLQLIDMALLLLEDDDEADDAEWLELLDEELALDWSGSAPGLWAAAVCS